MQEPRDTMGWFLPYNDPALANWVSEFEGRHVRFLKCIDRGDTVIDVGATTGEYTIPASHKVGREGRVYAFEPEPTSYACLTRNVVMHSLGNVKTYPYALSDSAGTMPLYYKEGTIAGASFRRTVRQDLYVDVDVHTLDDFAREADMGHVDMLKITTNGHEVEVLRGAREVLPDTDQILLQVPTDRLDDSLGQVSEAGFYSFVIELQNKSRVDESVETTAYVIISTKEESEIIEIVEAYNKEAYRK